MTKAIDIETLTLAEASRVLPGRPHVSTLIRWGKRGVNGVRLRLVKVGGRWAVSRDALDEFVAATTAAAERTRPSVAVPCRQQAQRTKADTAGDLLDSKVFGRSSRSGQGRNRTAS